MQQMVKNQQFVNKGMPGIHKLGLLLIVAVSSVVFIEPAPYDVLAIGLTFLFFILGLKPPRGISTPFMLLLALYSGWLIATIYGEFQDHAFKALGVRIYLILSWLLFASLVYHNPKQVMKIVWHAYIFAGIIAVTWGFMEYFGLIPMEDWEGGQRAKGPFKDPNVYGPFLVPIAMFALYQSLSGKHLLFYLPIATLFFLGILLSFSRGAWINTAMSLFIIILIATFSKQKKQNAINTVLIATVAVMLILASIVYLVQDEVVASRFSQRTSLSQNYDLKEGGRFHAQKKVLEASLSHPLGFGAGSTDAKFGMQPHNVYLHIMSDGGWIAFFGFVSFVLVTLIKAASTIRRARFYRNDLIITFACICGILFQSFFVDTTHWRHMYMLFGLLWGLLLAERHTNTRQSRPENINT